jgi:hypothetical protein
VRACDEERERTVTGDGEKRERRRVTAGPERKGRINAGPTEQTSHGRIFTENRKYGTAAPAQSDRI